MHIISHIRRKEVWDGDGVGVTGSYGVFAKLLARIESPKWLYNNYDAIVVALAFVTIVVVYVTTPRKRLITT